MSHYDLAAKLQEIYGEQKYKLEQQEISFRQKIDVTITSRYRSFHRQMYLVRAGHTRTWLSQHSFGLAFDAVPRGTTIAAIRSAAKKSRLILVQEKTHLHLQWISGATWRRFQNEVQNYIVRLSQ